MFIHLSAKIKGPKGGYGMYFRVGRFKGVKLLKGGFKSFHSALNSPQMRKAMKEAELLYKAEGSGVSPKCYGTTIVKRGKGGFRVGILMEHLGNVRLADLDDDKFDYEEVTQNLIGRLEAYGIDHLDLHEWNIMYKNGQFYAIDFSPDYTQTLDEAEVA